VGGPEVSDQVDEPRTEVAAAGLDPEEGRELTDGDRHTQAEQKAGHHAVRDQVGDAAEAQEAGASEDRRGDQGQRCRQRRELDRISARQRTDGGG
jgi:hypothetical protein